MGEEDSKGGWRTTCIYTCLACLCLCEKNGQNPQNSVGPLILVLETICCRNSISYMIVRKWKEQCPWVQPSAKGVLCQGRCHIPCFQWQGRSEVCSMQLPSRPLAGMSSSSPD